MANKKGRPDPSEASQSSSFDLTPMIDVTFLLIVFFMCVTEIADSSKANLKLPRAQNGLLDDKPVPGRLLINILKDGKIEINARSYTDAELSNTLAEQYAMSKRKNDVMSDKPILIRADTGTKYEDVQKVMQECTNHNLYRISFAALSPEAP